MSESPTTIEIKKILNERYGLGTVELKGLTGYDNRNLLVHASDSKFVLKLYSDNEGIEAGLLAESEILLLLQSMGIRGLPLPVEDLDGCLLSEATVGGEDLYIRLLTYLDGELAGPKGLGPELLFPLGKLLAEIAVALRGLRLPAIEARRNPWDLQHYRLNESSISLIQNPADRKLVEYFFRRHKELIEPELENLPIGVIHGDPNEWNVVETADGIKLIDFGDACRSQLVNDLAIAACYAAMFAEDPISGLDPLIEGYSSVRPLSDLECSVLFQLIAIRLCISVCMSARARVEMPDNEYALLSEERAWSTLRRLAAVNPLAAEKAFRGAAGLTAQKDSAAADIATRRQNTSAALSLQFEEPIEMRGAAFQYMFDSRGNSYLDCYNNIPHVGHCHPRIAAAGSRASMTLNTNTRYLTREFNEYSEALLSRFPRRLSKVFLVNSGSAATDLALRLARTHTRRKDIIVSENGYHGNSQSGIEVSHYKYAGKGGPGKAKFIIEAPTPNALGTKDRGRDYFAELESAVEAHGRPPAAFLSEPIVGCGGQVPLPEGYAKSAYRMVRDLGGVCISDEVQTGFGRLGRYFWGYEMLGVEPDIVILGKPMGNGFPIGGVVTTEEVAASFETGMEFFSSFGGNTVACAVGKAVLEVIDDEQLAENAEIVGAALLEMLCKLVDEYDCCVEARGAGLFLGLELARGELMREPATDFARRVKERLKSNHVLVGTDGPFDNVIKSKPPMCLTMENGEELAARLEVAIAAG